MHIHTCIYFQYWKHFFLFRFGSCRAPRAHSSTSPYCDKLNWYRIALLKCIYFWSHTHIAHAHSSDVMVHLYTGNGLGVVASRVRITDGKLWDEMVDSCRTPPVACQAVVLVLGYEFWFYHIYFRTQKIYMLNAHHYQHCHKTAVTIVNGRSGSSWVLGIVIRAVHLCRAYAPNVDVMYEYWIRTYVWSGGTHTHTLSIQSCRHVGFGLFRSLTCRRSEVSVGACEYMTWWCVFAL